MPTNKVSAAQHSALAPNDPRGLQHKQLPVYGFKVLDEAAGIIEAIVAVFGNVDYANERILPGATTDSINKKLPKAAWAHDWTKPIGKTLFARELPPGDNMLPDELKANGGLYVKGQLNLGTQRGKEAFSDLTFGSVDEFSIGYRVLESQSAKDGATDLVKLEILEWSPVLIGCNPLTELISAKDNARADNNSITAKDMDKPELKDTAPSQNSHFKMIPGVGLKGEYLGESVEESLTYYLICDLTNMLSWACWRIVNGEGTVEDKVAALGAAIDEMKAIVLKVAPAMLEENVAEEAIEKALEGVAYKSVNVFAALHAADAEVKEGKKFSKKSRKMLTDHCDAMESSCKDIRKMLEEDDTESDSAEGKSATTAIDVKTGGTGATATGATAEQAPATTSNEQPPTEEKSTNQEDVNGMIARMQMTMSEVDSLIGA